MVSTGGGAAGIACLNMLLKLGVKRENVWLCDIAGLVYEGRTEEMTPQKADFAQDSDMRTLEDVIEGADVFLGLSGPGVLKSEMVAKMSSQPIVFALANPQSDTGNHAGRSSGDGARCDYCDRALGFSQSG